ncbi:MAG: hypothetical protein IPP38_14395 [Bacteroidetes bacterium]|nr:hypothetical protein [Bacteroidota bacterium]
MEEVNIQLSFSPALFTRRYKLFYPFCVVNKNDILLSTFYPFMSHKAS